MRHNQIGLAVGTDKAVMAVQAAAAIVSALVTCGMLMGVVNDVRTGSVHMEVQAPRLGAGQHRENGHDDDKQTHLFNIVVRRIVCNG